MFEWKILNLNLKEFSVPQCGSMMKQFGHKKKQYRCGDYPEYYGIDNKIKTFRKVVLK